MTSLPPQVHQARGLLRSVVARSGAESRIYRRITAQAKPRSRPRLRFSVVTVGLLLSASAALGFGLAAQVQQPLRLASRSVATAAPKPSPPRQLPRGGTRHAGPAIDASVAVRPPTDVEAVVAFPTDDSQPELPPKPLVSVTPPVTPPAVAPVPAVPVSELSQQVSDYRAAVARLGDNPTAALERLREFRRRWPHSALMHEVDLRIIQVLVTLGRASEAEAAAQRFLLQYPDSVRAPEIRRIARANASSSVGVD